MGHIPSLAMLVLVLLCRAQSTASSGSSINDARALDALLQDYAYRALVNPDTGVIYEGVVPSNLTGIKIAALRLRSGTLRRRGREMYKEFEIPAGLVGTPYVERLVLVYQNLGNWSTRFYQLPSYTYLTPVLGLLAYDGSNLSATNVPELGINVSSDPILVKFEDVKSAPSGSIAKCVWFDLQGSSNFSNVTRGNTCSTSQQGHFSIVVESTAPSPAPSAHGGKTSKKYWNMTKEQWIIVVCVVGGVALLVVSLLVCVRKFKVKNERQVMEREAEAGEALRMASVGGTIAPAAAFTRTIPTLEHEDVP